MRFIALFPVLLCIASLILSFLCLFAGSSRGFLEDYALLTLNTSRLGENLFNTSHHSSNPFTNEIDGLRNWLEHKLDGDLNELAQALGIRDFYSAHILDYCEGYYVPGPVANATVSQHSIHKNVTFCSNRTALYHFDPESTLQQQLSSIDDGKIDLDDLHWPSKITTGLHALRDLQSAVFVLYCIGISITFIALAFALVGVTSSAQHARWAALANVIVDWFAFLALGLASAIVTAVIVEATHLINKYGNEVGVSASLGGKFLALTWVATLLMLLASLAWCLECVVGRKRSRTYTHKAKQPY